MRDQNPEASKRVDREAELEKTRGDVAELRDRVQAYERRLDESAGALEDAERRAVDAETRARELDEQIKTQAETHRRQLEDAVPEGRGPRAAGGLPLPEGRGPRAGGGLPLPEGEGRELGADSRCRRGEGRELGADSRCRTGEGRELGVDSRRGVYNPKQVLQIPTLVKTWISSRRTQELIMSPGSW